MHALSVNDVATTVFRQLFMCSLGVTYVEVVAFNKGNGARLGVPIGKTLVFRILFPYQLFGFPVHQHACFACGEQHERLIGVGESGVIERTHLDVASRFNPLVNVV